MAHQNCKDTIALNTLPLNRDSQAQLSSMTGSMSNSVSARAYSQNTGAGNTVKCCVTCGEEIHQSEPRRATPGNMAVKVERNGEVLWFLPLGTPIFGGSKRGSVDKKFAKGANGYRGEYKLPTKASDWIPVQGPCQQVTLSREAVREWQYCRTCYRAKLQYEVTRPTSSAEIIIRKKNGEQKAIVVPDKVLLAKQAKAKAILASLPPERVKRTKASIEVKAKVDVPLSVFMAVINKVQYVAEARTKPEARNLLCEYANISVDKFSSDIYRENAKGEFVKLV